MEASYPSLAEYNYLPMLMLGNDIVCKCFHFWVTMLCLVAIGRMVRAVSPGTPGLLAAALFHLERMKLVVEPSGAVGLAALRTIAGELAGLRVAVIISGGNTDFRWLEAAQSG